MSESSGVATSGEAIVRVAVFNSLVMFKMEKTLNNLSIMVMDLSAKIDNTETKLRPNIRSWIINKFEEVRVFSSGLDKRFFGAEVAIIINSSLACHVSKIEDISGQIILVWLLFKGKLSVTVLGLYASAFAVDRFG
ncbi:hypothetical protein G9A89_011248 [Geosiphon pyriformis]|nr:hypothetical protein G9A89_011248 [Geosiphon pyriformis]